MVSWFDRHPSNQTKLSNVARRGDPNLTWDLHGVRLAEGGPVACDRNMFFEYTATSGMWSDADGAHRFDDTDGTWSGTMTYTLGTAVCSDRLLVGYLNMMYEWAVEGTELVFVAAPWKLGALYPVDSDDFLPIPTFN